MGTQRTRRHSAENRYIAAAVFFGVALFLSLAFTG